MSASDVSTVNSRVSAANETRRSVWDVIPHAAKVCLVALCSSSQVAIVYDSSDYNCQKAQPVIVFRPSLS